MTRSVTIHGAPRECKECGSTSLAWLAKSENKSGVQEGRLRTHEVSSVFVLGCDDCSETLRVVSADKIAELLNKPDEQPPAPNFGGIKIVEDSSLKPGEFRLSPIGKILAD